MALTVRMAGVRINTAKWRGHLHLGYNYPYITIKSQVLLPPPVRSLPSWVKLKREVPEGEVRPVPGEKGPLPAASCRPPAECERSQSRGSSWLRSWGRWAYLMRRDLRSSNPQVGRHIHTFTHTHTYLHTKHTHKNHTEITHANDACIHTHQLLHTNYNSR